MPCKPKNKQIFKKKKRNKKLSTERERKKPLLFESPGVYPKPNHAASIQSNKNKQYKQDARNRHPAPSCNTHTATRTSYLYQSGATEE